MDKFRIFTEGKNGLELVEDVYEASFLMSNVV